MYHVVPNQLSDPLCFAKNISSVLWRLTVIILFGVICFAVSQLHDANRKHRFLQWLAFLAGCPNAFCWPAVFSYGEGFVYSIRSRFVGRAEGVYKTSDAVRKNGRVCDVSHENVETKRELSIA